MSQNLFGRTYDEAGSTKSDFVIKTRGKVKIQYGSKFIDLIKDGKINADVKFIYKQDEVGVSDGIYVIGNEDDLKVVLRVGDDQIDLGGSGNSYVSFLVEQEATPEQKYTALRNIGFTYASLADVTAADLKNGIVYVEDEQQLYIIHDGQITSYSTTSVAEFANPFTSQFVIAKTSSEEGALVIQGTGIENALMFDTLTIYSDADSITRVDSTGEVVFSNTVVSNTFQSDGATSDTGFRIYIADDGQSILEVDQVVFRKGGYVKLKGETEQIVEGILGATGDIIAYASSDENVDITSPIASDTLLGYVKVGNGLAIAEDGTLSVTISEGASDWSDINNKPSTISGYGITDAKIENGTITIGTNSITPATQTDLNKKEDKSNKITSWSSIPSNEKYPSEKLVKDAFTGLSNDYVTIATSQTITGQKTFTKDIIGKADVVAYYDSNGTQAAFKYWKPSVDSNGNLSWTNTSSEDAIATVNIKGPAGTGGWAAGDYTPNGDCRVVSNDGTTGKLLFINNSISTALRLGPGNGIKAYADVTSKSQESTWTEKTGKIYLNGNGCYIAEDCSIQGVNITASKNIQGVNITATDTVTYKNLKSSSDIRLKDKVSSLSNVLDQINTLDVFSFKWKEGDTNTHIGVAAQEVQKVFPDLVNEGIDGYLSMDYQGLSVVGIQAIKELYQLVKDQQEEINQLKEKLNDITK